MLQVKTSYHSTQVCQAPSVATWQIGLKFHDWLQCYASRDEVMIRENTSEFQFLQKEQDPSVWRYVTVAYCHILAPSITCIMRLYNIYIFHMFSYHVDRHDILVSWTRSSPGPATWHQCQKLGSLSSAAALNKCFGLAQHEPWRAERFRRRFEEISPRSPRSLRDLHSASFWWLCAFVLVCVCVTDVLACPGRLACLTCPGLCMCETYVLVHVHLSICMFISCSYIRAHECQNHNGWKLTYGHSPSASWMAPESPVSRMPVPWSFLQTYKLMAVNKWQPQLDDQGSARIRQPSRLQQFYPHPVPSGAWPHPTLVTKNSLQLSSAISLPSSIQIWTWNLPTIQEPQDYPSREKKRADLPFSVASGHSCRLQDVSALDKTRNPPNVKLNQGCQLRLAYPCGIEMLFLGVSLPPVNHAQTTQTASNETFCLQLLNHRKQFLATPRNICS